MNKYMKEDKVTVYDHCYSCGYKGERYETTDKDDDKTNHKCPTCGKDDLIQELCNYN